MKEAKHIEEAKHISADSWQLLNFMQLRKNASKASQIEALRADQLWQENHNNEIIRSIDRLIEDINGDFK